MVTGIASLAVHDKSWAWFLLAVAGPVAAVRRAAAGVAAVRLRPRLGGGADGWPCWAAPRATTSSTSTARGYTLLGLGLVLLMLVVVTLPVGRRAPAPR